MVLLLLLLRLLLLPLAGACSCLGQVQQLPIPSILGERDQKSLEDPNHRDELLPE
jgi:hypothetical protein